MAVVIPCLNEEEPIAGVVREVLAQGVDDRDRRRQRLDRRNRRSAQPSRARMVVSEPRRGYGRACAAGVAAVPPETEIVCFLDGDGSDVPDFLSAIVGPIAAGEADFVMGSRLRGRREAGQHDAAADRRGLARGRADAS